MDRGAVRYVQIRVPKRDAMEGRASVGELVSCLSSFYHMVSRKDSPTVKEPSAAHVAAIFET